MVISLYDKIDDVMSQGASMIEHYRRDPVLAAYDLLGIDLAPIQRIVLRDMWFKNFVITVMGRGGGKCQAIDSISFVDNKGLSYLYEEFDNVPLFLRDGESLIISSDKSIYTSEGFKPVKRVSLEKQINGIKLITKLRLENKGSHHHPLLTIDVDGNFYYKQLQDFRPGDYVCVQRGQNTFGSIEVPYDDAYLIGLFIGDGSIGEKCGVPTITTADDYIKSFCSLYCESKCISYRIDGDKRTESTVGIAFKQFEWFFEKYNIKRCLSYYKEVPKIVRGANEKTQISFLRGLFDADGGFEKKGIVTFCSVSEKLVKEVQMMLLNFGIISRKREKKTTSEFGKAFILTISGEDVKLFYEFIGFNLWRKQEPLEKFVENNEYNTNKDIIPFIKNTIVKELAEKYGSARSFSKLFFDKRYRFDDGNRKNLSYNVLNKIVNTVDLYSIDSSIYNKLLSIRNRNYYFDVVESVEPWQGDCYDFEMDMDSDVEPNYFCNGFINHNTFLLAVNAVLHALLYPGYRVGLIGPSFRQSLVLTDSYNTFWTNNGLYSDTNAFYDSVGVNIDKIQSLYNQNRILSKWKNEDRDCIGIKTSKGYKLSGTADHAIVKLDIDNGDVGFVDLMDLRIGDYILLKTGFNYFGNNNELPKFNFTHDWRTKDCTIPTMLTPDLSYLFGLIVGDGCVSIDKNGRKNRVIFTSGDEELIDIFKKLMLKYFDIAPTEENNKDRTPQIIYYCKKLVEFLLLCGFTKTTALDKKIPDVVKTSSKECFLSFIRGLMDTDGSCYIQQHAGGDHCEISLSTSSKILAKEFQAFLLNIGIVSSFNISNKAMAKKLLDRDKYSVCSTGYKVRIIGEKNLRAAYEEGLFLLDRKKSKLSTYVCNHFKRSYSLSRYIGLPDKIVRTNQDKYSEYLRCGFYFVKVINIEHFFAPTFDIEVENEHCYWAGGFVNHNSKYIFAEVENLYDGSVILREATEKKPVRGADSCSLKFRNASNSRGSYIEAMPIGVDGAKIRGSRFYLIQIDELAQVPPNIIDTVIRPMAAVSSSPMERVRERQRRDKLISAGLAKEEDFEEQSANKIIMASSGYFKFNHMWRRMKAYWRAIKEGYGDKYAVHQIPYQLLPPAFLDEENIREAERTMSSLEFYMEYEAGMASDSDGFFKASLLEDCTIGSNFNILFNGHRGSQYVMGIDPNQGGSALCGIVIVELDNPNKIVYVEGLKEKTTQEMTIAIQKLTDRFNIVRIFMDSQGGGKPIRDLLQEGYNDHIPILDLDDDTNKSKSGKRILKLVNPTSAWISDANFDTLALLENRDLRFPVLSLSGSNIEETLYEGVRLLKSQMLNIVVTQTARGIRHFDTPKKGQNKDLYSALILAAWGVRELGREDEISEPVLHAKGLIRPHRPGARFTNSTPVGRNYLKYAVLEKK